MTSRFKNTSNLGTRLRWQKDKEIAQKTPGNIVPNILGAFIRTKKIGNLVYYYLVKSYFLSGRIQQKVLRYYGVRPPRKAGPK